MKKLIIYALVLIIPAISSAQSKGGKVDNTKHPIFYTCTEKLTVLTNELGKCPLCGMDLKLWPKEQIKFQVVKSYGCPLLVDLSGTKSNLSPKEEMKMKSIRPTVNTAPLPSKDLAAKQ